MNKFDSKWVKETCRNFQPKELNKISETQDYLIAKILDNNQNVDILTVQKFVNIIENEFYFKLWKKDEFDRFMTQVFNEIYEKINPIKNNWPKLQNKYIDLSESINESLSTSGDEEDCKINQQNSLDEIAIKKYLIAILNQTSNYTKNSVKTEQMNRSLIDDLSKILSQPTELNLLKKAVLSLQPYVYNQEYFCGNCGYCRKCLIQQFDPNKPYFNTLMREISELKQKVNYFDRLKRGPKGEKGNDGSDLDVVLPLVFDKKDKLSLSFDRAWFRIKDNELTIQQDPLFEVILDKNNFLKEYIDQEISDLNIKIMKGTGEAIEKIVKRIDENTKKISELTPIIENIKKLSNFWINHDNYKLENDNKKITINGVEQDDVFKININIISSVEEESLNVVSHVSQAIEFKVEGSYPNGVYSQFLTYNNDAFNIDYTIYRQYDELVIKIVPNKSINEYSKWNAIFSPFTSYDVDYVKKLVNYDKIKS